MTLKRGILEAILVVGCAGVLAVAFLGEKESKLPVPGPSVSYPSLARQSVEGLGFLLSGGPDCKGAVFECFDFLCGPCHSQFQTEVRLIRNSSGVEWKALPFPLRVHEGSYEVALASYRAGENGHFLTFYARTMSDDSLIGLGAARFFAGTSGELRDAWSTRKRVDQAARRDLNIIKKLPVAYTPCFIAFNRKGNCMESDSPEKAFEFARL